MTLRRASLLTILGLVVGLASTVTWLRLGDEPPRGEEAAPRYRVYTPFGNLLFIGDQVGVCDLDGKSWLFKNLGKSSAIYGTSACVPVGSVILVLTKPDWNQCWGDPKTRKCS